MGLTLRKLLNARVVVVFGASSRIGRAAIEELSSQRAVAVVAAVEDPRARRARLLRRATGCFLVQVDSDDVESLQRAMRHTDAVLLVPPLSTNGTRVAKRIIDAAATEQALKLVIVSSVLAASDFVLPSGAASDTNTAGFEAVEAHARAKLPGDGRVVSLRVPMLMETLLYCRDEIIFANRVVGCFSPSTRVPSIAVRDVALAAAHVLLREVPPGQSFTFDPTYTLMDTTDAMLTPLELTKQLSEQLHRPIKYVHLPDEAFLARLADKNAPEQVAHSLVQLKTLLESENKPSVEGADLVEASQSNGDGGVLMHSTQDFERLTRRALVTPAKWLNAAKPHIERTQQNQIQLFLVGAGDAVFVQIGEFLAHQVTEPTTEPPPNAGESALSAADVAAQHHAKVTLCTIKSTPAAPDGPKTSGPKNSGHYYQFEGEKSSPVMHLLDQLSELDVVLFIPPLRLGAAACLEVTKNVTTAAAKANAWGIVVVSSVFAGEGRTADSAELHELDAIEQAIKASGVSYTIVRLPLFLEYFLALSSGQQQPQQETKEDEQIESRPLLADDLADAKLYWMALSDAAKALVAIAFTFPLHRNKVRTLFTLEASLRELVDRLEQGAYKKRQLHMDTVDALEEAPNREFWKLAFWPRRYVLRLFESAIERGDQPPLTPSQTFEFVTDCEPIGLDRWVETHAKAFTKVLSAHP